MNATPETFWRLRGAALLGWSQANSSVDAVSTDRIDIVISGYGDKEAIERGLRDLGFWPDVKED